MDTDTLFMEVLELCEAGDEKGLRTFLAEHINEFPEEIRDQIVIFFFEEAITDHANALEEELEFKRGATETLEMLGTMKKIAEDQLKTAEVRERLQKHTKDGE